MPKTDGRIGRLRAPGGFASARALLIVAALLAAGIGGYWYGSPYLAIQAMKSAAEARDAEAFNRHVDYPTLRERLKDRFAAMLREKMAAAATRGNAFERAGVALGSALGMAMVERMVDTLLRPEMVMHAMAAGTFRVEAPQAAADGESTPVAAKTEWRLVRESPDRIIAHASADAGVGLVFERSGFATWKLTEIRPPEEAATAP